MEFAALANQFGPWVALAVYVVVHYFKEGTRKASAYEGAVQAHIDSLKGAVTEGRATGKQMSEFGAKLDAQDTKLSELRHEIEEFARENRRLHDRESDEPEPISQGRKGR